MTTRHWLTLSCAALLAAGCSDGRPAAPRPEPAGNGVSAETEPVTKEDVKRKIGEAARATGRYLRQSKADYERDLEKKLEDLDVDIEKLKRKAADLKDQAEPRWEEQMKRLEARRAQAEEKLEEIKAASPEAWEDLKAGARSAWDDLKQGFDEASEHFESRETTGAEDS